MQDNGGKLVWFFAGAAMGATIALLYAPKAGEDTRRILNKKARDSRDVLTGSGRDIIEKGRDLYERGRRIADDAAEMFERGRKLVER